MPIIVGLFLVAALAVLSYSFALSGDIRKAVNKEKRKLDLALLPKNGLVFSIKFIAATAISTLLFHVLWAAFDDGVFGWIRITFPVVFSLVAGFLVAVIFFNVFKEFRKDKTI